MGGRSASKPKGALGRRTLRRGARGPDVVQLQNELRRRGYDPGASDGQFGFLTEDALRDFQADYALRPDGIAGPEVYTVLQAVRPVPVRRRAYRVPAALPLSTVAERLGVSPTYLAWINRLKTRDRLQPGHMVHYFPRWLLLQVEAGHGGLSAQRIIDRYGAFATGVIDGRASPWTEQESASLGWPDGVAGWVSASIDLTRVAARLRGERSRWWKGGQDGGGDEQWARLLRWAAGVDSRRIRGLHVERPSVPWGQGLAWARGASVLSESLWRYGLTLLVTVSLSDVRKISQRLFGDLHLDRWVPLTEAVIVRAPDLGGRTSFMDWYARLDAARRWLPLWKCVAGLDLRAVERDPSGRLIRRLSHQQALALCYRQRVRPSWDEEAACNRAVVEGDGGRPRHLYMWNREALTRWVERVQIWGLAGVRLAPMGGVEERIVAEAWRHMAVARHVGPVPSIHIPEGEGGLSQ